MGHRAVGLERERQRRGPSRDDAYDPCVWVEAGGDIRMLDEEGAPYRAFMKGETKGLFVINAEEKERCHEHLQRGLRLGSGRHLPEGRHIRGNVPRRQCDPLQPQ